MESLLFIEDDDGIRLALSLALVTSLDAVEVQVTGGKTSVALDTFVLDTFGLSISGTSDDVLPGSLPDSVGFGINARDAETVVSFRGCFGGRASASLFVSH